MIFGTLLQTGNNDAQDKWPGAPGLTASGQNAPQAVMLAVAYAKQKAEHQRKNLQTLDLLGKIQDDHSLTSIFK